MSESGNAVPSDDRCSVESLHDGSKTSWNTNKKGPSRDAKALDVRYLPNGCPYSLPNGSGADLGSQCGVTL